MHTPPPSSTLHYYHRTRTQAPPKPPTPLYVCTHCGWRGNARDGSEKTNNHATRNPNCPFGPCLVLNWPAPGVTRKAAANAYLTQCTRQQRQLGLPPEGGCARAIPTPKGCDDKYQWVEVELPAGVGPGDTFEHLNHNGRYVITVKSVPDFHRTSPYEPIRLVVEGNKRERRPGEQQKRAERAERAVAERAEPAAAAAAQDAAQGVAATLAPTLAPAIAAAAPDAAQAAAAALAPAPAPSAAPPAGLATGRAALVERAKAARENAMAGKSTARAKRQGSEAMCEVLREALCTEPASALLEPFECDQAITTARRTYHQLMTGHTLTGRREKLGADAPWPSNQPGLDGYRMFATGLDGALAGFMQRYAGKAIARRLHCEAPPLMLFKPTKGEKEKRLCFYMCADLRLHS